MNKNNDNKIKLTFHPAEFGAKMPIPLAEQSVKAGFPSPAQDYMEGEIDLNDILVRHREATFYVRISGDSMQDGFFVHFHTASFLYQFLYQN
jgi:DNA polymerase V